MKKLKALHAIANLTSIVRTWTLPVNIEAEQRVELTQSHDLSVLTKLSGSSK